MAVAAVAGIASAGGAWASAALAGTAFTWGMAAAAFAVGAGMSMVSRALMPKPDTGVGMEGLQNTVRNPVSSRKIVYGEMRTGGTIVYIQTDGTDNKYLHMAIVWATHEIESIDEIYFNEEVIWKSSSLYQDLWGNYVTHNNYLGTQTTSDPLLDNAFVTWTADHKLEGVAYTSIRMMWDADQFQNGIPNITAKIKGKKVLDPRTSTTVFSKNPALCLYDYMRDSAYGLGEDAANFNTQSVIDAADICDETDAEFTGARYELNGVLDTANKVKENIEALTSAMAGHVAFSGGEFFIYAGAYRTPFVQVFNETHLVGDIQLSTKQSRRSLYNAVKGVFVSSGDDYIATDYPAQISSTYSVEDGDPIYLDMPLPFTTEQDRAQRLAKIALLRSRQQKVITMPMNMAALQFKAGDTIYVTNEKLGFTNKVFEVIGYDIRVGEQIIVDVQAIETDAGLYDWTTSDEQPYVFNGETPNYDGTPIAPTSLQLNSYTHLQADGTHTVYVDAAWTASADAFIDFYRFKYTVDGVTSSVDTRDTSHRFLATSGSDYTVAVTAFNLLSRESTALSDTITPIADTTAPDVPTSVSATGLVKSIELTWDNPSQTDFKHVEVYVNTTNTIPATPTAKVDGESYILGGLTAGNTRYFWLKSVDFTGNKSAATASVNGTAVAVAAGTDVDVDFADVDGQVINSQIGDEAVDTDQIAGQAVNIDKIDVSSIFADTAVINAITANAIDVATLNANNIDAATSLTVGTDDNVAVMSGADATYRIWAGKASPSTAPFSVDKDGNVVLKNISLYAGGVPLIDDGGFTPEALSIISATTQTEVDYVVKNFTSEDPATEKLVITTNQATTVSAKFIRDGFAAVSTTSGNQAYYEIPLNATLKVHYKKSTDPSYTTLTQTYVKTASTSPTSTQYQVETILNETPTGDRWYAQTVPNKGCVNSSGDLEKVFTSISLDADTEYWFYLELDTTIDTTGDPDTIDSDVSATSSKTLTISVTSGSGFYVSDGTGSQGTTIDADTLGGELPSYYASTTYVANAISNLVDSAPATLDTLNELAAALGDDPNFATTVSTAIGTKWTQDNDKISNWNTAYGWGNHSTQNYAYTTGDTFTGNVLFKNTGDTYLGIQAANLAFQRVDSRNEGNFARAHWYGVSDTGGTSNFRHAWYTGSSYVNLTAESGGISLDGCLRATAFGNQSGSTVRLSHPDGASYNGASGAAGAIQINLPVSWTNTMMTMKIQIYEYSTNESFEVHCGGYNYSGGNWVNTFAYIVGSPDTNRNFTVRFGHTGSVCCIVIGETTHAWPYVKVMVTEFAAGHSNSAVSTWDNGWSVSLVSSLPTITETQTYREVGIDGYAKRINGVTVIDGSRNLTNISGLYFTPANSRIYFNGHRALEGSTTGSLLQIGEGYTTALLQTQTNAQADIRSAGQIRATGWYGGVDTDYNGLGYEIGVSGSTAYALSYNRDTSSYGPMAFEASSITLDPRGSTVDVVGPIRLTGSSTSIKSDSTIDFLTLGNAAQYGKFYGLSCSNSYNIGSYGGYMNALNGFMVNNTTVISSSRNIVNIGTIDCSGSITTSGDVFANGGDVYVGNGSSTNGRIEYRHTNGSHVQHDVRPLGTNGHCWLHKYTNGPSGYGQYAENWWDGNSYHSIQIAGGVFYFGGGITATGDVTAYSDERLKENIETLDGKKVLEMRGVSFTKDGKASSGVIAQEIEKVAPELVNNDGEYKAVAYGNLVGYLIEAVKDQQKEIDELKALVKQLLEK